MAVASLTDPGFIKKSLILPFQFLTAFEELNKISHLYSTQVRIVMAAIGKAIDISLNNVPVFDGSTLVVLDVSGSMTDKPRNAKTGKEMIEPAKIGALFAAVISKTNNADLMLFDNNARYVNYNPMDVTLTLANNIEFTGGGTNFPSIFQTANKKYDRIIILSDMQGWMGNVYAFGRAHGFEQEYRNYKTKFSANPKIYSFDLAGYGTMQMPENNVYLLAGFSDKTMQLMAYLEKDKNALINEIRKIEL